MYDSILLDIKCPNCGKYSKIECQTKDLQAGYRNFKLGDFVGDDKVAKLNCIAECKSDECMDSYKKIHPYSSGYGKTFYVEVLLNQGVIGDYIIK